MTGTLDRVDRPALAAIADPNERVLCTRFYRYLAEDDLPGQPVEAVLRHARSLLALAAIRPQGAAGVREAPPDGSTDVSSVLEVVTDDMPFLVDSVSNALAEAGRGVHLVVHPQLVVRRDRGGALLEILDIDVDDERPAGTLAESWMWIEIERDFEAVGDASLEERIRGVLRDVRVAVRDWRAMRSRAVILAEEIAATPPRGLPADMVSEGVALLRWLADDNLTFLGYREYLLDTVDGQDALVPVPGSGLGILSADAARAPSATSRSFAALPPAVRQLARAPELLILTKANSRSTVHRPVYLDYVGVKSFDAEGNVVGERRFVGLLSSSAYTQSVLDIPVLRRKFDAVLRELDFVVGSHNAKDLLQFLETYPRDELFQVHDDLLARIAASVLHLQERRHTKLYLRPDDYGRFMSCLVYLPRDRYTTPVRRRIEALLTAAFAGSSVDYTVRVSESLLARVHFVIRVPEGQGLPDVDVPALEAAVSAAARSW
ncbi:MAG: NAD-glutamate dehydrogenase, partial [Candidatus Nanopelagicales bacterium]